MHRSWIVTTLFAAVIAAHGIPSIGLAQPASDAPELTFAVYTSDKPTEMYRKFQPFLDYLNDELAGGGLEHQVRLKIYPSYAKALDELVQRRCDFVRFGPASYIMANQRSKGIRLLAMEHKDGEKTFDGVFIARADADIASIADLRGKSFAFGNASSTIGRYLSQAEFVRAGIYATDLASYKMFDRHDQVAAVVAAGTYDAGVVKENTYRKYEAKGLKEIGRFTNVTKPWIARAGMPDDVFTALSQALLSLTDESILDALGQDGFVPATDTDYALVREGMAVSRKFDRKD